MKNISYKLHFKSALLVGAAIFVSTPAYAGKSVSSPYVSQGELKVEAKTEFSVDDDSSVDGTFEQGVKVGYGLTERIGLEAGIEFEDEPGEDIVTKALEIETKVQLTEKGDYFVDGALKFSYTHNTSTDADKVAASLILAKAAGKFSNYANFKIKKEIGEDSADNEGYEIKWKTKYDYSESFDFGVEYYADFLDLTEDYSGQKHRIGPVGYGHIGEIEYQIGVLAGISEAAPDATLKFNLEYEF